MLMNFPSLKRRGSSPRVWGQETLVVIDECHIRIIPTRVGTSFQRASNRRSTEDHPHACGDKGCRCSLRSYLSGSSPRVWGQAITVQCLYRPLWIIPTRVGTSPVSVFPKRLKQDHPHACGDKQSFEV